MQTKILGRDPALIVGLIVAIISWAGTFGYHLLTPDQAGIWITVVNAIAAALVAWTTRPLNPAVYTYLVSTFVALGGAYGLNLSPEFVNGLNGMVVPLLSVIIRAQISPIETGLTKASLDPTAEAARHEAEKANVTEG